MNIEDLLEYLCDLLNIKTENDLVIDDILQELEQLEDGKAFINFVKTNMNHNDYKYLTGFQKFIAMAKKFKGNNTVITDKEHDSIVKFADTLYTKLTDLFLYIQNESYTRSQIDNIDWKHTKCPDGNDYFTDKEIIVVDELGDTFAIYEASTRSRYKLFDKLKNIAIQKTLTKKQNMAIGMQDRKMIEQ